MPDQPAGGQPRERDHHRLADLLEGRGDDDAVAELQWCVHAVYWSAADALIALYRSNGGAYLDLDVNANARYRSSSETIR